MNQRNSDVRLAAKQAGVYLWQIGESLGLSDGNFSRLLRKELSPKKRQQIFEIIADIKQKQEREAVK